MPTRSYASSLLAVTAMAIAVSVSARAQTSEAQRQRGVIRQHLDLMNRGEWRETAEYFTEDVQHHLGNWRDGTFILLPLGDGRRALMQSLTSAPDWGALAPLVGEWVAVGGSGGQPGVATRGGETWTRELDGHVLVRRDFSEYPATAARAAFRHEGLAVFSRSPSGALRAHLDDNEGHSIDYDVAVRGDSIVLTSAKTPQLPTFRLTYEAVSSGYAVRFEMAPPDAPLEFRTYVSGAIHRVR